MLRCSIKGTEPMNLSPKLNHHNDYIQHIIIKHTNITDAKQEHITENTNTRQENTHKG